MSRAIYTSPPRVYASRKLGAMESLSGRGGSTRKLADAELMLRYAAGDARAFDQLYARHKGPLYRYLLRLCHDRAVADDLFQDVWDRVIRHRKRYRAKAKFATFLYRIAHNCAVDQFRLRARRHDDQTEPVDTAETLSAPASQRPDRQLADSQFREAFQLALDALPAEQRAVFLLYEESGLGLEEIGEITGVGTETAKSRLRYAVAKLRKALGSMADYSNADLRDELAAVGQTTQLRAARQHEYEDER